MGEKFTFSNTHAHNIQTIASKLINQINLYQQALEAENKSANNTRLGTMTRISELESENEKFKEKLDLYKGYYEEEYRKYYEQSRQVADLKLEIENLKKERENQTFNNIITPIRSGGKTRRRKGKKGKRTRKH